MTNSHPYTPAPAPSLTLKQRVFVALEKPFEARPVGKICGIGLIVLIVLNALLVGLPDAEDARTSDFLIIFGVASTIAFGIEYCCRVWTADLLHPDTTLARARLRYIFSPMGIVDFLSFVPALFVPLIPASAALNDAIRIIRLVRLVKISRYMRGLRTIGRVFATRHQEIVAAFMVLALLAVASSVLMFEAEHDVQPGAFDSVWTGLYWAVTTMTTTGYGDIVPVTPLGRFIGFMTMVLSIGVVAIPAGIFSAGFVEEFRAQRHQKNESEMGTPAEPAAHGEHPRSLAPDDSLDAE